MMLARSKLKRQENGTAPRHRKPSVKIFSFKQSKRQRLALCLREKMKRLLQGPVDKISANHDNQNFPVEIDTELFVCGIKRTPSSAFQSTVDNMELKEDPKEAIRTCVEKPDLCFTPSLKLPVNSEEQNSYGHAEGNSSDEEDSEVLSPCQTNGLLSDKQDLSAISITMSWREISEQTPLFCPNIPLEPGSRESTSTSERSGDVVEYIIKELQGISRIQAEIAELRQHLSLIKGSVEEVSTCVDSVLNEIEGLQVGIKKPGIASSAELYKDSQNEETVLYFYGISEHEGENTLDAIHCFLSAHHCFTGIQSKEYIKDAYRLGNGASGLVDPRPTVVKLARREQRDIILQNSVQLQSGGVRIVPFEEHSIQGQQSRSRANSVSVLQQGLRENRWSSVSLDKGVVRTDDFGGERKTESFRIRYKNSSTETQCAGEDFVFAQKSTKCNLTAELEATGSEVCQVKENCELEKSVSHLCIRLDSQESQKNLHITNLPSSMDKGSCRCARLLTRSSHLSASSEGDEAEIAIKRCCSIVDEHTSEGLCKGENELVSCDSRVQFRSTEKINVIIKDPSGSFTSLSFDDTVDKRSDGTVAETLKEVVHIDLDTQDQTGHVFRDFLNQPDENIDIVDIKFYANKLGKALNHFRSALKVVFNKLESPEAFMESKESGFPVHDCDSIPSVGSGHFNESIPTQSSRSNSYSSSSNLKEDAYFVLNGVSSLPHESSIPSLIFSPDVDLNSAQPLSLSDQTLESSEPTEELKEGKPMRLDQVCAETIYLNKCINNFKNVLKEKKKMQRKLLKDIVQETFWVSGEEMTSDEKWEKKLEHLEKFSDTVTNTPVPPGCEDPAETLVGMSLWE